MKLETRFHDDTIMPFGTHAGKTLGEIPDSYWLWFLNQKWCDDWPGLVKYANCCVKEEE
jgi:uncharacterized protein (DUF3820 family)